MPKLNKSLINDLKADIGRGLSDSELRKKHGISEPTWCRWKHRGVIDRSKGLTTIHTMLLDRLREGREVVKQIENIVAEMALSVGGEAVSATTTTYKDKSGEIIKTKVITASLPDNLVEKAALLLWNNRDPENWDE